MRVLILGPIVNEKLSGGVGVFDEGLYHGFKELGDEVQILSAAKSSAIDNLKILDRDIPAKKIIFHFGTIAKKIKKYKPDLVISSLQYTIGIKKYKRHWKNATYVSVLHGVPSPTVGRFKYWVINKVAKYSKKHCDKVVTVSYLSYALNKRLILINCDKVIYNGCNLEPSHAEKERIYDFVYVGRLSPAKEVEMIGDAFVLLNEKYPNLRFAVAGYGKLENLFTTGKFKNTCIEFKGKLTQNEVKSLFEQSKFFVSMNSLEPFGIVFSEAATNGCNLVTQSTTGACGIFVHKNYFHTVDCLNATELASRLEEIKDEYHPISEEEKRSLLEYFSFKRCAKEYRELADQK